MTTDEKHLYGVDHGLPLSKFAVDICGTEQFDRLYCGVARQQWTDPQIWSALGDSCVREGRACQPFFRIAHPSIQLFQPSLSLCPRVTESAVRSISSSNSSAVSQADSFRLDWCLRVTLVRKVVASSDSPAPVASQPPRPHPD